MRSWRRCAGAALALLLVGCAPTVWTKPGADAAQRDADLASCEAYARDQTEDFLARIEDTQRGVTTGEEVSPLETDFRRVDQRSRRLSLTASCMRQLGYSETEVPGDAGGAVEGADDAS